jgi:hypothetical protein
MRLRTATLLLAWAAPAAMALEADSGSWSVGVTTSGGFAGIGRGNVLVDSGGKVMAARAAPAGRLGGSCEGTLSEAERRRIAAAVKGGKPEGWAAAKSKIAAPDAFGYVLELRQGEEAHEAAWYDNTADRLPPDLKELYASVAAAWDRVVKDCAR